MSGSNEISRSCWRANRIRPVASRESVRPKSASSLITKARPLHEQAGGRLVRGGAAGGDREVQSAAVDQYNCFHALPGSGDADAVAYGTPFLLHGIS